MKYLINNTRRRVAAVLIAFASMLSIATARFERDQQSCGMMAVQLKRKRPKADQH